MTDAKEVARRGIIGEQNALLAQAYAALLAARDWIGPGDAVAKPPKEIAVAIEAIESYRQKRDPG